MVSADPLSREALARVLQSLITAELASVRRRSLSTNGRQTGPHGAWRDDFGIVGDGADTLGCDSLEIMWLAGAVNEMFHLHEVGGETGLLSSGSFGDWLDRITAVWRSGVARITFTTSGSTGVPKRCTHSFDHLQTEIRHLAKVFATRQRIVAMAPAHHIYGFLFTAMLPDHLDVAVLNGELAETPASLMHCGDLIVSYPERWSWLNRFVTAWSDDIEGVVSTAPCPPDLIARLKTQGLAKMTEVYGSSETAGIAMRVSPDKAYRLMPQWRFDATSHPASPALIHSSGMQAELMDQLCMGPDHTFTIAGRRDGALQIGGMNVHPGRIASMLRDCPGVAAVSVRLMRPEEGDRLKAFIVPDSNASENALRSELETWSATNLSTVERPRLFTFGTALPQTVTGKPSDW